MRRSPASYYNVQDMPRIAVSTTTVTRWGITACYSRITLCRPCLLCVPRSRIVTNNAPVSRHYQPVIGLLAQVRGLPDDLSGFDTKFQTIKKPL